MSKQPLAVVGIGQTKHVAARRDVSIAGLVREAAGRALQDADLTWSDIDAVVIGKAPDFFEGLMMPELCLADALGAVDNRCCAFTPPARSAAPPRSSPPTWSRPACTAPPPA